MSEIKKAGGIKICSIIIGFLIFIILTSGCTSSIPAKSSENQTISAETTAPTVTTIPSLIITTPSPIITLKRATITLGPLKTVKDLELWFTMQVPESWEVTSEQMSNPEGYEGLVYLTLLLNNTIHSNTPEFYIITYAITRDMDQSLRANYRHSWNPLNESTVTINGINFDRFESKTNENVKVAYVVRKGSANERGFASVIEYSIDSSSQYKQEDFESLISTFHYVAGDDIKDTAGEEIKRPNGIPLFR